MICLQGVSPTRPTAIHRLKEEFPDVRRLDCTATSGLRSRNLAALARLDVPISRLLVGAGLTSPATKFGRYSVANEVLIPRDMTVIGSAAHQRQSFNSWTASSVSYGNDVGPSLWHLDCDAYKRLYTEYASISLCSIPSFQVAFAGCVWSTVGEVWDGVIVRFHVTLYRSVNKTHACRAWKVLQTCNLWGA